MKGDATVIFNIEAVKIPRQVVCLVLHLDLATRAGARFRHRGRRAHLPRVHISVLILQLR